MNPQFSRSKHKYPGNESMTVVLTGTFVGSSSRDGTAFICRTVVRSPVEVTVMLHGPVIGVSSKKNFFQMEQVRDGEKYKVNVYLLEEYIDDPESAIRTIKSLMTRGEFLVSVVAKLSSISKGHFSFSKDKPLKVIAKELRVYFDDETAPEELNLEELDTQDDQEVSPEKASKKLAALKQEWAGKGLPNAKG